MPTTVILEKSFVVSAEMVQSFADTVGDHNPIHVDAAYAATTRFKTPIAQGLLVGSLISGRLVEAFGDGTVYVEQHFRFRRPVAVGSTVTVVFSEAIVREKGRLEVKTEILLEDGRAAVTGSAIILPGVAKELA